MFNAQSHANVIDQIDTIDVPIKFTRTQLEKMLRAVDAEGDDEPVQPSALLTPNALIAIAVKKAADLI